MWLDVLFVLDFFAKIAASPVQKNNFAIMLTKKFFILRKINIHFLYNACRIRNVFNHLLVGYNLFSRLVLNGS
jgi:hypothetical protein